MHRIVGRIREIRRLRRLYTDRLLTLLTVVLLLAMFVFAPLQAVGIFVFQGFAIAALLAIIGSMMLLRWALIVRSVAPSSRPISLFIFPRATRSKTCRSRGVRLSTSFCSEWSCSFFSLHARQSP